MADHVMNKQKLDDRESIIAKDGIDFMGMSK